MKRRITKKESYICRRIKNSDKTFSIIEAHKLAYYQMTKKRAYVVRLRKINDVIFITSDKTMALDLANSLNCINR